MRTALRLPAVAAAALAVSLSATTAFAQFRGQPQPPGAGGQPRAEHFSQVRVLADTAAVKPGETFHIVVMFRMSRGWHVYWKNPGEGAMAPDVNIDAPEGFEVGEIRWPRPKVIDNQLGKAFGYAREAALFIPVTAPDERGEETVNFATSILWGVCDDRMCLIGRTNRTLSLPWAEPDAAAAPPRDHEAIETHRRRLPVDSEERPDVTLALSGTMLLMTGPAGDAEEAGFIPLRSPGVKYGEPQIEVDKGRFIVTVSLDIDQDNFLDGPPMVGGVVALGESEDDPSYEFSMPLPETALE